LVVGLQKGGRKKKRGGKHQTQPYTKKRHTKPVKLHKKLTS